MLRGRRRALALAAAALVAAVIVVVLLAGGGSNRAKTHTAASKPSTSAARLPVVSVDPGIAGATIADGFLGLSIEYWAIEAYAGKNPDAVNPVLARLIADLAPDQTPVLRIGGVSTDQTWWPVAGVKRPPASSTG